MMDHFYTSTHGAIVYLCERGYGMPIAYGYVVKRLA